MGFNVRLRGCSIARNVLRRPAEVPLEAERRGCREEAELQRILTDESGSVLSERSPRVSRMLTKCSTYWAQMYRSGTADLSSSAQSITPALARRHPANGEEIGTLRLRAFLFPFRAGTTPALRLTRVQDPGHMFSRASAVTRSSHGCSAAMTSSTT